MNTNPAKRVKLSKIMPKLVMLAGFSGVVICAEFLPEPFTKLGILVCTLIAFASLLIRKPMGEEREG